MGLQNIFNYSFRDYQTCSSDSSRMTHSMVQEFFSFHFWKDDSIRNRIYFLIFLKILKFWDPIGPSRHSGGRLAPKRGVNHSKNCERDF